MLKRLRYEIDDENHRLNVTVPDSRTNIRNVTIRNQGGQLQVLVQSAEE